MIGSDDFVPHTDNRLAEAERRAGVWSVTEKRQAGGWFAKKVKATAPRGPLPDLPVWPAGPGAKTLLDLGATDCKFPVGEADSFNQLFCADPRAPGRPYCPACEARVASGRKLTSISVPA